MRDSQRTILAIGLVAALVQLVVWPPRQVFVHAMGGDATGEVRRWVPVWRPVEGIIQPTTGEQIQGFPSSLFVDGSELDVEMLAVQMAVTVVLTSLLLLAAAGRAKPS